MAQHTVLTCDQPLSGGGTCEAPVPSNASTKVGLDGEFFQVDLCAEHRHEVEVALAGFKAISRPYTPPSLANVRKVLRDKRGQTFTTADVRAWLAAQGREGSHTGRVPKAAIEEYRAAHA